MDRNALKNLTHNAKDFLNVHKGDYKQWVFRYTFLELEKDLAPNGDITTESVLGEDVVAKATVVAGDDGIVAGLEEIMYFLVESDPRFRPRLSALKVEGLKKDGEKVCKGDKVLVIEGAARDVLAVERVVLNLLMRMSGVATYTTHLCEILRKEGLGVLITPTRKTLWGLLDKKAVVIGGGGTHRLNLSDAILVKDNHLALLGGSFTTAIKNISESGVQARFIEIEVEDKEGALKAAEALSSFVSSGGIEAPACIMFDNMKSGEIEEVLKVAKSKGFYDNVLFEASGGICEENLVEYAKTGVDIISMGCLTMGSRGLDFRMEIE
ncbi:MAG: carboxylating nicotinate-nucleotide diphosphorylase [Candidatus Gracilibacteria bacterium]